MNCKGTGACHFVWLFFPFPKPWLLLYKCPSDTHLCWRRSRNFCLSEMMSSVYPKPLYSKNNCNQIPSCYPAFSTALTCQCHPLWGGEVIQTPPQLSSAQLYSTGCCLIACGLCFALCLFPNETCPYHFSTAFVLLLWHPKAASVQHLHPSIIKNAK